MMLDQVSLLVAISVSSSALCVMLFGAWIGSRRDFFLLHWSSGLAFIIVGILAVSYVGHSYNPTILMASFLAILVGLGFVVSGSMEFRMGRTRWRTIAAVTGLCILPTALAFSLGFSGAGTIAANLGIAVLLVLAGWQSWAGRSESPAVLTANAILYALSAVSFALCGLVLALDRQWTLTGLPSNWAESLNTVVVIVGLTGIGALSFTANQTRISRYHRLQALTDPLTKLLNRRALLERYSQEVRPRTAAIIFDLDHFKAINDRYGHPAGDAVLRRFSEILSTKARVSDVAARVGGEEFCMILHNVSQDTAVTLAQRIRAKTEAMQIVVEGVELSITVSAGVAYSTGSGQSFEALLELADKALYDAKTAGRNTGKCLGIRLVA